MTPAGRLYSPSEKKRSAIFSSSQEVVLSFASIYFRLFSITLNAKSNPETQFDLPLVSILLMSSMIIFLCDFVAFCQRKGGDDPFLPIGMASSPNLITDMDALSDRVFIVAIADFFANESFVSLGKRDLLSVSFILRLVSKIITTRPGFTVLLIVVGSAA